MAAEKFEYKGDIKFISMNGSNTRVCETNGLKCDWSGKIKKFNSAENDLHFLWKFNWDELKKEGIDRLSGYIIVKPAPECTYSADFAEQKIDVDLKESNQIIEKDIRVRFYNDYCVLFEYSLVPHYIQIKEVEKKELPSEQNNAVPVVEEDKNNANKEIHSDAMVPVPEQNDTIPVKEEQKVDVNDEKTHSDGMVSLSEQNGTIPVKEEKKNDVNDEKNLLSQLDEMFLPSEQNDAILVIDGKKIHVSKAFLSYHSEYFRTIFSLNDKDGKVNEIPIEGISFEDFKLLHGPISSKPVFPTDKTVEKILELATRFKMPSVIVHCEHHLLHISKFENDKMMLLGEQYEMWKILEKTMLDSLSDESVEKLLELAERYKRSSLIDKIEFYLLHNSIIENEKMMWIGEKYGMAKLLEKSILEMDTLEKAKKWKLTPEYANFSFETKSRVLDRLI